MINHNGGQKMKDEQQREVMNNILFIQETIDEGTAERCPSCGSYYCSFLDCEKTITED